MTDPIRRTSVALHESEWKELDRLAALEAKKFDRRSPNRSAILRRFMRFAPQVREDIRAGRA